ncbi:hypothetical protein KAU04_05695, partial [bacterium]|nr:hypothetical protein [bacterium]
HAGRSEGDTSPFHTTPVAIAIGNGSKEQSRQLAVSEMQDEKCKVKNAKWEKQLNFAFTNPGSRTPVPSNSSSLGFPPLHCICL